mgnify:CR=1 FL=1
MKKLNDFGQKIGGAKKDIWAIFKEATEDEQSKMARKAASGNILNMKLLKNRVSRVKFSSGETRCVMQLHLSQLKTLGLRNICPLSLMSSQMRKSAGLLMTSRSSIKVQTARFPESLSIWKRLLMTRKTSIGSMPAASQSSFLTVIRY